MKSFIFKILCCSLLFFSSCSENEYVEHIKGQWKTVDWTLKETQQKRPNQMDFNFMEDKAYEVDYGSEKEKGKYWLEGADLYTIENGGNLKKVKITSLENDTLVFEMNRAGSVEIVTLKKIYPEN